MISALICIVSPLCLYAVDSITIWVIQEKNAKLAVIGANPLGNYIDDSLPPFEPDGLQHSRAVCSDNANKDNLA